MTTKTAPRPAPPAEPKALTIRQTLESAEFQKALRQALPRHLTPERMIRIAITALTRTPNLAQCDRPTFLREFMRLSQLGLEPDGYNAHLIPFWNSKRSCFECVSMIDYKGSVSLVMRSGLVSWVYADKVCENDEFFFNAGVVVNHAIDFKRDRGPAYAYYCKVRFKDGAERADCMARAEVDRIRLRSKTPDRGPWDTDYDEMAKKTVFRRMVKWLPISSEIRDAIDSDVDLDSTVTVSVPRVNSAATFSDPGFLEALEPARAGQEEPNHDVQKEEGGEGMTAQPREAPVPAKTRKAQEPTQSGAGPSVGTAQQEVDEWLKQEGFSFSDLSAWGIANRWPDFDSYPDVQSIPHAVAKQLMAAQAGLREGLKQMRDLRELTKPITK